jgi:hypothetical protein
MRDGCAHANNRALANGYTFENPSMTANPNMVASRDVFFLVNPFAFAVKNCMAVARPNVYLIAEKAIFADADMVVVAGTNKHRIQINVIIFSNENGIEISIELDVCLPCDSIFINANMVVIACNYDTSIPNRLGFNIDCIIFPIDKDFGSMQESIDAKFY